MGKCPFDKKKCNVDCVLYRKGMRYWDDPHKQPQAFEECAINVACDCLENLVTRAIGQQKVVEQSRNEMTAMKELFYALATRKMLENHQETKEDNIIDVE